jgi:CRISPR-associated endonuclease/helicase Cas3
MDDFSCNNRPIAHAAKDANGQWRRPHHLEDHLAGVAAIAGCHARAFGAEDWARLAGLWHDLGKYRPAFQAYIRNASGFEAQSAHVEGAPGRVTHSTAGALWAIERLAAPGRVLAYLIAGHHAGLHDWVDGLEYRLSLPESRRELDESLAAGPSSAILDQGDFAPDLRAIPGGPAGFALWVRLLFSCLVDADFLDTESYMDPGKFSGRGDWPELPSLSERFAAHMAELDRTAAPTPVNALRRQVRADCLNAAALAPGLFSLTVPTGGGKTLSSMAFALEHARRFGKRRIIYVIPYTSIIEQTADVLRRIFGDAVIEHHSNAETDPEHENTRSRLACENWDAPIVVTTSVQCFESLFAARTSRCRKLHNMVNSVIVLDEAQLLPPDFLQPILDVLNLLTRHYGVTVVLSTATQPALASRDYFDPSKQIRGLEQVREIIPDPDDIYRRLKRVDIRLPADWNTPTTWEDLAAGLSKYDSVLAIVNTRRHARDLYRLMPPGALHLSALLCGAHRSALIGRIKLQLIAGIPTRVISTQLVEAGVDVDFPAVYRALAGLDSIAQAAGRCNREGLAAAGEVVVFIPPDRAPPGLMRKAEDACRATLYGHVGDPLNRALFAAYFERLYYASDLDAQRICDALKVDGQTLAVGFSTAAKRFRLIEDADSAAVIVRYLGRDGTDDTVDGLLGTLRKGNADRWLMRKLQRYTVNIRRRDAMRLQDQGDIEEILPGLFAQTSDMLYHPELGLLTEGVEPGVVLMA